MHWWLQELGSLSVLCIGTVEGLGIVQWEDQLNGGTQGTVGISVNIFWAVHLFVVTWCLVGRTLVSSIRRPGPVDGFWTKQPLCPRKRHLCD